MNLGYVGSDDEAGVLEQHILVSDAGVGLPQHLAHVVVLLDEHVVEDLDSDPPARQRGCEHVI